jgi:hypothetical protein
MDRQRERERERERDLELINFLANVYAIFTLSFITSSQISGQIESERTYISELSCHDIDTSSTV